MKNERALSSLQKYIYIIDVIFRNDHISLEEIKDKYKTYFDSGHTLSTSAFERAKKEISEIFYMDIEYNRSKGGYYISNKEDIKQFELRKWLIETFQVDNILHKNPRLRKRILLENVPSGQKHLIPIVDAINNDEIVLLTYQSYSRDKEPSLEVEPLLLKLFKQRWYLVGKIVGSTEKRIFSLDRIEELTKTKLKFKMPKNFDADDIFINCYGVMINDDDFDKSETVMLKVDAKQAFYLRSLPLHHSQKEVECNGEYSIFSFFLCPALDFRQKILSLGDNAEVLEPADLRRYTADVIGNMSERYK